MRLVHLLLIVLALSACTNAGPQMRGGMFERARTAVPTSGGGGTW